MYIQVEETGGSNRGREESEGVVNDLVDRSGSRVARGWCDGVWHQVRVLVESAECHRSEKQEAKAESESLVDHNNRKQQQEGYNAAVRWLCFFLHALFACSFVRAFVCLFLQV